MNPGERIIIDPHGPTSPWQLLTVGHGRKYNECSNLPASEQYLDPCADGDPVGGDSPLTRLTLTLTLTLTLIYPVGGDSPLTRSI